MLIPLRNGEIGKLIPGVATSDQFSSALGNPRKVLQKLIISSIGGVITLLISQSQITSQFYSLWLVLGVIFILYILWSPIYEASRKNYRLKKYKNVALFQGYISDIYIKEIVESSREQSNSRGQLELIENKKTWIFIELEDVDGFLSELKFPLEKKHKILRRGQNIMCLAFSNNNDFRYVSSISDAWIPDINMWIGEYPYLLRPAFIEFCRLRGTI